MPLVRSITPRVLSDVIFPAVVILMANSATVAHCQESYPVHPDTQPQAGVPEGKVLEFELAPSRVYPGTQRQVKIYVPAQYREATPAAVMVFQDGPKYVNPKGGWQVHRVFDNLIHRSEMPVTIGIFVSPGVVDGGDGSQNRFNRSLEYDTVSDRYAKFIVDEVLPQVGKSYDLTADPNLRAIAGSSSGAIAAFGVAWHRPNQFRRVFSTVGTFVGLRGGNEYPTLIRKSEPKPIRIYLQDGSNDLNIYGGSWWNANQTMLSALQWAGYAVKHTWGEGGHNGKHGAAIFPDAMKWVWRDWHQPIESSIKDHVELKDRLVEGESWTLVSDGHAAADGVAVAPNGQVYFSDARGSSLYRVVDGGENVEIFRDDMPSVSGLMFDSQGRLYCARNALKKVTRIDPDGSTTDIASGISCNDLVVLDHGVYLTGTSDKLIWYIPHGGQPIKAAAGPVRPNGIICTPDKRFLIVVDSGGRHTWSYRIEADGRLVHGQPYHYVHSPQAAMSTGGDGATMTADGSLLVASTLGIQVFDQPGRAHVILSRPVATGRLTNCVMAGPDMSTLYVTVGGSVYRRETQMVGHAPWQEPVTPPKPRL